MAQQKVTRPLANYVRMHRRKAGLTQRELGLILGYGYESPVSRHERFRALPPLVVAIGYEIVFRIPISEMFAGVHETVKARIEARLADLELHLREEMEDQDKLQIATKKLKWLAERNSLR